MAHWFDKVKRKWVVSYYPEGAKGGEKRRVIPPEFQSEEGAANYERLLKEFRARHNDRPVQAARPLKEYRAGYYAWLKAHRSPNTARDVENTFKNHVMVHLGGVLPDRLTPAQLTAYKEMRIAEGGSNRSINKEVAYLRGFFKYLSRELGACQPLNFRTETLPYQRPVPDVMGEDEAMKVLAAAEPMYQAFFLLEYGMGLRRNEARMLRWEDVDLDAGHITITRKGGKRMRMPLMGWPRDALRGLYRGQRQGWVFRSTKRNDRPIWDARDALARAKKAAGIPAGRRIHNHLFRHSIATRMMQEGVPMRIIQEFLGHGQMATTEWYTHVLPEALKENMLIISRPKKNIKPLINKKKKAR